MSRFVVFLGIVLVSTQTPVLCQQASYPEAIRIEHWNCLLGGCRAGIGTLRQDGQATYEYRRWPDTLRWPDSMLGPLGRTSDTVGGFTGTIDPNAYRHVLSLRTSWSVHSDSIPREQDGYSTIISVRFGKTWGDLTPSTIQPVIIRTLDSLFGRTSWSVQNHRLSGKWDLSLAVQQQGGSCSPDRLEGRSAAAVLTVSDSANLKGQWGYPEQLGGTDLTWGWLGRGPVFGKGEVLIAWINESTVTFSVDHWGTHDGGLYGQGRWAGDSVAGEWEQAGYCPTPSGPFVLRKRRP